MTRLAPLLLLALWQMATPTPNPRYFGYRRAIAVNAGSGEDACTLLTPEVFAHAAPSLTDLRLYSGSGSEVPYAVTLSQPDAATTEPAHILNLGERAGHIAFDLTMPDRPYTEVLLDLGAKDFLATAKVEGRASLNGPATSLGEFTLFDLTSQHLSRNTAIGLQESTFPFLHVDLALVPAPGTRSQRFQPTLVEGAQIPPSREAQTLYTPVVQTAPVVDAAMHRTVAKFEVPAHVPVERVSFVLDPSFKGNFSRAVTISATGDSHNAPEESLGGEISRVEMTRAGAHIQQIQLSVPATLGVNMQHGASVTVAVEDGDDKPLPIAGVRLEMRERKLCFHVPADALTLYYGDPALRAPMYDFARLFTPTDAIRIARPGPEQANPNYTPRPDMRPYTERHPDLLWLVLLAVIGVLAVVAFRSTKQLRKTTP